METTDHWHWAWRGWGHSSGRHTEFPSFGESMSTYLLPSQMLLQDEGEYPSTEMCGYFLKVKLSPRCPTWGEIITFFIFSPTEGFVWFMKPGKVAWTIPSCGSPLTCCHAPAALLHLPRYWATWNAFSSALCMQLQNKKASQSTNFIVQMQLAAPSNNPIPQAVFIRLLRNIPILYKLP